MPAIDPTALSNIQALSLEGRAAVCEYLKVIWDGSTTNYYSSAAWQDEAPFESIGLDLEPRIIPKSINDPFHEMELQPDLRTEAITVTFDDIDKSITTLFQTYGSGVTCEFFLYYADEDVHVSLWHGQLQAPDVYGWKTVKAKVTNGYRSRELHIPSRNRRRECTAAIFGGLLPDTDAVRSSLCPYDKHLGGSVGNFISGSTPYADCPKTFEACVARLGNSGLYYGGFETSAGTLRDNNTGYLAVSKGNASNLKEPVRVIFGQVHARGLALLQWLRQQSANNSDGFVLTVWDCGEGPVSAITNFQINDTVTNHNNLAIRLGTRGQSHVGWLPSFPNFSSTAIVRADYGRVDATAYSPDNLEAQADIKGFAEVCVYTDDSPVTKTRIWSDNRVWCLLELYKNQKFGLGYAESKFDILDWMTAATWSDVTVSHTVTYPDGETQAYASRRSTLNAILEGRPVGEQVEDVCRSGGLSIPFEYEGDLTLDAFRKFTAGELSAAKIFYDTGQNVNICWDGQPTIELSQVPDNKLVNEVEVRFEEASNKGTERPLTVDDRNQKLKAGRLLGPDYFLSVPKKFTAFGITSFAEAIRFAYRLLWFGEFDEGGTQNNLKLKLTVPFEQTLNLRRYGAIKVVSELLDPHTIGTNDGVTDLTETPEYFRILKMKKIGGGRCEITAQAYNHTAYTAFEVDSGGTSVSSHPCIVRDAGSSVVDGDYEYTGESGGYPTYRSGTREIYFSGQWLMTEGGTEYYEGGASGDFPWDATWVVGTAGIAPAPYVYEGFPPEVGLDPVTIDTPTYNDTTGIITVVVN